MHHTTSALLTANEFQKWLPRLITKMENQHPDNRFFSQSSMKKWNTTFGSQKELQTASESKSHYLQKQFICDMVDLLLLVSFKLVPWPDISCISLTCTEQAVRIDIHVVPSGL